MEYSELTKVVHGIIEKYRAEGIRIEYHRLMDGRYYLWMPIRIRKKFNKDVQAAFHLIL